MRPARNAMAVMIDNVRYLRMPSAPATDSATRFAVNWSGTLTTGQTQIPCSVLNISPRGAKVRLHDTLPPYASKVWLITDFLGPLPAVPTWGNGGDLGL